METSNKTMGSTIINTKSNFRNLNGTVQQVVEYVEGQRVTCRVWCDELGRFISMDFHPNECLFL